MRTPLNYSTALMKCQQPSCPPAPTETSPETRPPPSAWSPPRNWQSATLFLGAYPITPASDLLHNLARFKDFGVVTFQAEDEIAAICATIGAAWGGAIGVTSSSGPGIALKGEGIGLAQITELPIVVIDVQRGGPSTGLPTKTEQSDLNIALFGRHGEGDFPVIAAATPSDCFHAAIEAVRVATKYIMPVMLLSDGYLANGAEPWKLPDLSKIEPIDIETPEANRRFSALFSRPRHARSPMGHPWYTEVGTPHRRLRKAKHHWQRLL